MAQKVLVSLEDDLDGGKADETVTFGLDGRSYEIDLSTKNATKLRKALGDYINSGRRMGRTSNIRRASGHSGALNGDAKLVREWALANGYEVGPRGRIPAQIQQAYAAAQ